MRCLEMRIGRLYWSVQMFMHACRKIIVLVFSSSFQAITARRKTWSVQCCAGYKLA